MGKKRTYNKLTDERVEFIRKNYMFLSDEKLAEILGYNSGAAVRKIRQLLGLKKDVKALKEFIESTPLIIWKRRCDGE